MKTATAITAAVLFVIVMVNNSQMEISFIHHMINSVSHMALGALVMILIDMRNREKDGM